MLKRTRHIILFLCIGFSFAGFAQEDSLVLDYIAQKNVEELRKEQQELNFQKFFFQALQFKAIGNYDKAISALENCQNIKSNNKAVSFELAKNYFELGKYFEAESFVKQALRKEPENLFMLQLLKDTYNKESNFQAALEIQKQIVKLNANSQLDLVILYIKNNQIDNARQLLIDLEKKGTLSDNLIPFKESLLKGSVLQSSSTSEGTPVEKQSIEELTKLFETHKSFAILKVILTRLNAKKQYIVLEKHSKEGITLFPAQPLVYLMNITALNQMKQYQKALNIAQNGLDYVIDDQMLEADFYDQMSLSYKGLGQNSNASKYYNKAVALRQKKS